MTTPQEVETLSSILSLTERVCAMYEYMYPHLKEQRVENGFHREVKIYESRN